MPTRVDAGASLGANSTIRCGGTIGAADAQRLLVRAFAMEVVSRIAEGPARDAAMELLEEWTGR